MALLEDYKNHLQTNWFKGKRMEKNIIIDEKFAEGFLEMIINDTYSFTSDLLEQDTLKYNYCKMPVLENGKNAVSFGMVGGDFSDFIFIDSEHRMVSKYVLTQIFGQFIYIRIKEDDFEKGKRSIYVTNFPYDIEDVDKYKKIVNDYLIKNDIKKELKKTKKQV